MSDERFKNLQEVDEYLEEEIETEKRFQNNGRIIYDSQTYDEYHCDFFAGLEEITDLLNEQEQKIQRWKTLYEIKDKEVTARVKRLNEICNQYKYAITFDKDIDPNDAVNILCDRILQTEVEM